MVVSLPFVSAPVIVLQYVSEDTMRRVRTRRAIALLGIVAVVFASIVPTLASSLFDAVFTPLWLVAPAIGLVVRRQATQPVDQPLALLSLPLFRAPPAPLALV
jgi:hypothetical protein